MIDTATDGFLSVGQASARRIALRAAASGPRATTLLVHGPRGAGKDAFVDDLLALAFCIDADRTRRPCNACHGCRDARARTHVDLVLGSPESWREQRVGTESIVAAARRWLLAASGAPVTAERRIVVIEHADRTSEPIQNALLKALEEPTDRHAFILVADDATRLLPTIRSRCQTIRIGPVPRDELVAHLMDVRRLPEDQAIALARIANGLTGAALGYADRSDLIEWRRRVQGELLELLGRGPADRFEAARDLLDEASRPVVAEGAVESGDAEVDEVRTPASMLRAGAAKLVEAWIDLSRDLLVAGVGRPDLAPGGELGPELERIAPRLDAAELVSMVTLLGRIAAGLRENAAPRLALETAMLAWPHLEPTPQR